MAEDGRPSKFIKLFLCGDVMTGRGIDQAMGHSVDPRLYEDFVKDARDYLRLAEREHGNIPEPVSYKYLWGDAMQVWEQEQPAARLVNLETAATTHDEPWPRKGINYRMHPENVELLTTARIDHCSLANNHTLDWQQEGLKETIRTLDEAGIAHSGAGRDRSAAAKPAKLETGKGRVIIFSVGMESAGIPPTWQATTHRPGVNFLPNLGNTSIRQIKEEVKAVKQPGDVVVFSIHWDGNWGYDIPESHQQFAHQLIDKAGIDIIYGHSSHHPKGMEFYNDKLIIYGAGDFINDYEGISGHEQYRDDLTLMYFPEVDPATGKVASLKLIPMQIKKFQLQHPSPEDVAWLGKMLSRECKAFDTMVRKNEQGELIVHPKGE